MTIFRMKTAMNSLKSGHNPGCLFTI